METGAFCRRLTVVLRTIGIFICIWIWFAHAQDIEGGGQSRAALNPPIFSNAITKGSRIKLDLDQQEYPTVGQTDTQRNEYTNLGLDIDLKTEGLGLDAGFHGIY